MFYCVHGFLGKASDWDLVLPLEVDSVRTNLFSQKKICSQDYDSKDYSLNTLGKFVNSQVQGNDPFPILVGYSLGVELLCTAS